MSCTIETHGICYGADNPEIKGCADCGYRKDDCLGCGHSLSEPGDDSGDRLFCVVKQTYVEDDGYCPDFNQ